MFSKNFQSTIIKIITLLLMIQTTLFSDINIEQNYNDKNHQTENSKVNSTSENDLSIKKIFLESLNYKAQIILLILITLIGMFFLRNEFNDSSLE